MKLFVLVLLAAAASASSLENTYLPPAKANLSGGSSLILSAPSVAYNTPITTSFYRHPAYFTTYGSGIRPAVVHSSYAPVVSGLSYGTPLVSTPQLVSSVPAPNTIIGVPSSAVQTNSVLVGSPVPILKDNLYINTGERSYRYDYETANHIIAQEAGNAGPSGAIQVQGSYSYLAPNGEILSVNYVADENGFHPEGAHLPTPPPTPAEILKSLEMNAAEEARGIVTQEQPTSDAVEVAVVKENVAPTVASTVASVAPTVVSTLASVVPTVPSSGYLPPNLFQGGYKY